MTVTGNLIVDTFPQIVATVLGTLMAISDGMTYGWTSPMIPYLTGSHSHIPMTRTEVEFMETINILGSASGLPFVLYSVNKFGRKKSMLAASFLGCLCWIAIMCATNKEMLYSARFFAGIAGDICFVAAPMYVAEIADHKIRGFLSALIYLMMLFGVFIVYLAGDYAPYFVPPTIGIILTALQCILFPFMPESPYFYVYNDQIDDARKSLLRLRADSNVDEELDYIKKSVERQKTDRGKPQDLVLIRSNRIALIVMAVLNLGQHYSGITIMVMNLSTILSEAGSVDIESSVSSMIFASIMLIGGTTASLIIDKFGRKVLLITSSTLTGIILAILTAYFHLKNTGHDVSNLSTFAVVCVMLYAAAFKLGLGMVPIVITAEIFPSTIKAIGMTIAEVFFLIGAVTSVNMYTWLSLYSGIHVPFYILTFCSFFMAFFTFFFVPETKGKTLDEIQLKLKGNKK